MTLLKDYARQCFLGSERKQAALPTTQGQLQTVLEKIQQLPGSTEENILRIAASLHLFAEAGFLPAQLQGPIINPANPDSQHYLDDQIQINSLHQLLSEKPGELLYPIFSKLVQNKLLLAPKLLPGFFNSMLKEKSLTGFMSLLIGERGRWLLTLNKEWAGALIDKENINSTEWEEGSFEQALVYIQQHRQQNPDNARDLIAARLAELDARQRAQLMTVMSEQLSIVDENFLEPLLKDRSKEVRAQTASLLSRLPGSRFVERASVRMNNLLSEEKKLFRKQWQLNPPEIFDSSWSQDTIEEKRPQSENLGQKAWWLYQLILSLPLAWWEEKMAMTPTELIDWAHTNDWQEALLRAWQHACLREKNPRWASAFLSKGTSAIFTLEIIELVDCLPRAEKIHYWSHWLNHQSFSDYRSMVCAWTIKELCDDYRTHFTIKDFSQDFLLALMEVLTTYVFYERAHWDYIIKANYISLLGLIPFSHLKNISQKWPTDFTPNGATQELLAQAHDVLRVRQLFDA